MRNGHGHGTRSPAEQQASEAVTTVRVKVRGYHEDRFGHVNNATYLEFLEDARWEHLEERGLTGGFFEEHGIFPVVIRLCIYYRHPASLGDCLDVTARVAHAGRRKVVIAQKVRIAETGEVCAEAEITAVFIDRQTGRPVPLGDEILRAWPELRSFGGRVPERDGTDLRR